MNDIEAEDEWDMQARLLDGDFLQAVDLCRVSNKEERSDLSLASRFFSLSRLTEEEELAQLSDLLLKSHLGDE